MILHTVKIINVYEYVQHAQKKDWKENIFKSQSANETLIDIFFVYLR